jgi:hypothetical protein
MTQIECADHDPNRSLLYSIIYFFSIWLALFLLNVSPLGNYQVSTIGKDCYAFWKEYRDDTQDQMQSKLNYIKRFKKKYRKVFRCCRKRSNKLAEAGNTFLCIFILSHTNHFSQQLPGVMWDI